MIALLTQLIVDSFPGFELDAMFAVIIPVQLQLQGCGFSKFPHVELATGACSHIQRCKLRTNMGQAILIESVVL